MNVIISQMAFLCAGQVQTKWRGGVIGGTLRYYTWLCVHECFIKNKINKK